MLVDTSGSITSTQMTAVKGGLANFIDAFAGTPIKLEIVTFNTTSSVLGAGAGEWSKYYDMLNETDVATLKTLAAGSALTSGGYTNWEDGFFRILKNTDGTTQAALPNTILFFTDGVPTKSRLESSSASTLGTADPLDAGLGGSNGGNFYQVGWNRAERLIRDRGSIDLVSVFVGSASATSTWSTAGAGYHLGYQVGNAVVFQRGYHGDYTVGNGVAFQRGYHSGYEVGNAVVYQRGYHSTYERNNNVVYQKKVGSWVTTTQSAYEAGNTTTDSTDGWRTIVSPSLSSSWTAVTSTQFTSSNTTTDSTDGWRTTKVYGAPFSSWENTTQSAYDAGNITSSNTDGWQTIVSGSNTTWTEVSFARYTSSNTTTDSTDGWRAGNVYAAPFSLWETTTQAAYLAGNTTTSDTDGWLTVVGPSTVWSSITSAQYNASNTTADSTDGWQVNPVYSAPYSSWENTTQSEFLAGNTVSANTDGWQTVNGSNTGWIDVTKAQYDAGNTLGGSGDGWQTVNVYSLPYDSFVGTTSKSIMDYATLGNITVSNTSGTAGNFVEAIPRGGPYTNAAAADLFVLPDYTNFSSALGTIALGQCGGTVTVQTKVGANAAQDPFTYENTTTHEVVQTSAAYRSGTFDIALPGGAPQTVTINPQDLTSLSRYSPAGWSCKSAGVAYPFTVTPVANHAPWTGITLTVNANQAVSCTQAVTFG
jgi:hypothetical protein